MLVDVYGRKSGGTHSFLRIKEVCMEIVKSVREAIQTEVENLGYRIDDVVYEKEGSMNFLRVIIDKDGIMDLDDCVKVSKIIKPILDEKDFIEENYILDVCSKEKGSE